jgi:hypothetical protein
VKTCTRCLQPKLVADFALSKTTKDGLRHWCRVCIKDYHQKYHQEYNSTPERKALRKGWYEANKVQHLAQAKVRWADRKDAYEPARKKWAGENRDRMLAYSRDKGQAYRDWIDSLKAGHPCADCLETFLPYVMEYDHVRGVKRHSIGKMTNHKRERVLEEILKCDLVCCICHRIRTQARRVLSTIPKLIGFRTWIDGLKASPCNDCGRCYPPVAMDFDHLENKLVSVAQMWSWSRARVEDEIRKCQLVCANCHRVRSVSRLRSCPDPIMSPSEFSQPIDVGSLGP